MDSTLPDETRLKMLFKEAVVEALEQRREWLSMLVVEALEDIALLQAIKEGETTEIIGRDEIFELLGTKR